MVTTGSGVAIVSSVEPFEARVEQGLLDDLGRGRGPRPFPLVITHGWRGSVFETLDLLPRLTDPGRFGGRAADSFDVDTLAVGRADSPIGLAAWMAEKLWSWSDRLAEGRSPTSSPPRSVSSSGRFGPSRRSAPVGRASSDPVQSRSFR